MSPAGSGPSEHIQAYRAAHEAVLRRIVDACGRAGRDPATVTLVAVSKTVDAALLRDAVAAGLTLLAENRVQEAAAKAPAVPGAQWQLVGPLQGNKVRRALEVFEMVQSVDSVEVAERMDRLAREMRPGTRYPILLQVNVDDDPAKAGFQSGTLGDAIERIADLEGLDLRGLMTIGRLVAEPEAARSTFRGLRELGLELREGGAALGPELSMGMTADFDVAVEEGATIVRVGRALFGEREPHG